MSLKQFFDTCFDLARYASDQGEIPVGAIVVQNNVIISKGYNLVYTTHDPTAHAEIIAIRQACGILKTSRLDGCDIYVTLEPCTLCAAAISTAHIRRLYFGTYDPKGGGVDHHVRFFQQKNCFHVPFVIGGIRERESEKLLHDFFKKRRNRDAKNI